MKRKHQFLTPMQIEFVKAYNGNATAAARTAKYAFPDKAGAALMAKPYVEKAIREKQESEKKAEAKAQVKVGMQKQIHKNHVIARLLKLADSSKATAAQVQALKTIAEIEGFIVRKHEDMTKIFEGKSEAEKEFFALNGYFESEAESKSSTTDDLHTRKPSTTGTEGISPAPGKSNPPRVN